MCNSTLNCCISEVTNRDLTYFCCSDSEGVCCCFQVYLTVLKHGDSATLDTMLKVRLRSPSATTRNIHTPHYVPQSSCTLSSHALALTMTHVLFAPAALQLHKQADMQEEKNRIERVLGAISAPDLIQKVLTFALSVRATSFTLPGQR